jgi:phosphomannomutase
VFRVGIIAGLRSKKLDGKTIGVMVTASHNPEQVVINKFLSMIIHGI